MIERCPLIRWQVFVSSPLCHHKWHLTLSWTFSLLFAIIFDNAHNPAVAHFSKSITPSLSHELLQRIPSRTTSWPGFDLPALFAEPGHPSTAHRWLPQLLHSGTEEVAKKQKTEEEGVNYRGRRFPQHPNPAKEFLSSLKLRQLQTILATLTAPNVTAESFTQELDRMARQDWFRKWVVQNDLAAYRNATMLLFSCMTRLAPTLSTNQTVETIASLAHLSTQDALFGQHVTTYGSSAMVALTQRFTASTAGISATEAAYLVWVQARIGILVPKVMTSFGARIIDPIDFPSLSPKDISLVAWSIAKLQARGHYYLLHTMGDLVVRHKGGLDDFEPRSVALLAWGYAKVGIRHKELFACIAARSTTPSFLQRCSVRDIANLAWAMATVRTLSPSLTRALTEHLVGGPERRLELFGGQSASNLIWALATSGVDEPRLMVAVSERLLDPLFVRSLNPQGLANIAWASAKMGLCQPEPMAALSSRMVDPGIMPQFEAKHVSVVAWAFAKARIRNDELMGKLLGRTRSVPFFATFNAQDLSLIVWAVATLRIVDLRLMDAIVDRVQNPNFLETLMPQHVSNTVWAFAVLRLRRDPLLVALTRLLLRPRFLALFSPQGLSNTAWAYASLGFHNTQIFERFANRMQQPGVLITFTSLDVVVVMWAFATAQYADEQLCTNVADHVLRPGLLATFSVQDAALLAWSFATMGVRNERLMTALAHHIVRSSRQGAFLPNAVANTAWAFAKLHIRCDALFHALAQRLLVPHVFDALTGPVLSTTAWAFAMFGLCPEVLQAMAPRLLSPAIMGTLQATELHNVAWAFSALSIRHDLLFEALGMRVPEVTSSLNPQQTTGILWAFARLGYHFPDFLQALTERIKREAAFISSFSPSQLATTVWAFATLQVGDETLAGTLADAAVRPELLHQLPPDSLQLISKAFVVLGVRDPLVLEALGKKQALVGDVPVVGSDDA
eukprot:GGOE01002967.1.p1 GENE.GGOE01002967.1~~GGOE01002967.1.p1  ORF type:complete len:975 (-),score=268.54 GGOE01002967.1:40-2922(-)